MQISYYIINHIYKSSEAPDVPLRFYTAGSIYTLIHINYYLTSYISTSYNKSGIF